MVQSFSKDFEVSFSKSQEHERKLKNQKNILKKLVNKKGFSENVISSSSRQAISFCHGKISESYLSKDRLTNSRHLKHRHKENKSSLKSYSSLKKKPVKSEITETVVSNSSHEEREIVLSPARKIGKILAENTRKSIDSSLEKIPSIRKISASKISRKQISPGMSLRKVRKKFMDESKERKYFFKKARRPNPRSRVEKYSLNKSNSYLKSKVKRIRDPKNEDWRSSLTDSEIKKIGKNSDIKNDRSMRIRSIDKTSSLRKKSKLKFYSPRKLRSKNQGTSLQTINVQSVSGASNISNDEKSSDISSVRQSVTNSFCFKKKFNKMFESGIQQLGTQRKETKKFKNKRRYQIRKKGSRKNQSLKFSIDNEKPRVKFKVEVSDAKFLMEELDCSNPDQKDRTIKSSQISLDTNFQCPDSIKI